MLNQGENQKQLEEVLREGSDTSTVIIDPKEEKKQIDEQIEREIRMRKMPTVSGGVFSGGGGHQPKIVGLIILIIAVVLLGAGVYFMYGYLMSEDTPAPAISTTQPSSDTEKDSESTENTASSSETEMSEDATSTILGLADENASSTTEEMLASASTTEEIIANITSDIEAGAVTTNSQSSNTLALDTDGDGLSDAEEIILGTSISQKDTDTDGYADLAEIRSGYNPAGVGKLADNTGLRQYLNTSLGVSLLYPKSWINQSIRGGSAQIFQSDEGSLIQLMVEENAEGSDIATWYRANFDNAEIYDRNVVSSVYYDGIIGESGMTMYATDQQKKNIYIVNYVPAPNSSPIYMNIFGIMYRSLELSGT